MRLILNHIVKVMLPCIVIISVLVVLLISTNKIMTQLTVTNEDLNFTDTSRYKQKPRIIFTRELYVKGHDIAHPELCPNSGKGINLVILIHSAIDHGDRRLNIRLTWGHFTQRRDVVVAFILGILSNHTKGAALDAEDSLYGDLIRGRFIDTYWNLTLKSISMLEWFAANCPKASNLLKTDDDMFINVVELLRFVEARKRDKRRIYGFINSNEVPKREALNKHFTDYVQYPRKKYPPFASGSAYLITGDIVRSLFDQTLKFPYMNSEDVYLTGIIANHLKIHKEHREEFRVFSKKPETPCEVRDRFTIHKASNIDRMKYWEDCFNTKYKCKSKNYNRN